MILVSQAFFGISLAIGAVCLIGAVATYFWQKKAKNITPSEEKICGWLFMAFFLGFLIFGFTPVFFWLLFLPV